MDPDVRVPMRDGTVLAADLYRPAGPGRRPVLLMRNPYNRRVAQTYLYAHPSWYAARGYAVVVQDTRGRWGSGGEFDPVVHEAFDGADTIDWAAGQPWSNGRVGMYGFSYPGMVQLLAAAERPAGLQAIAPTLAPAELREGGIYRGGAFALGFALGWALELGADQARRHGSRLEAEVLAAAADPRRYLRFRPLRELPLFTGSQICAFYFDWIERECDPGYWAARQAADRYQRIRVPGLHVGGWYDLFLDGTLRNWSGLQRQAGAPQRLVVGPWHHIPSLAGTGPIGFGAASDIDFDAEQLAWFDLWLRDHDVGLLDLPPVRAFLTGANRWVQLSAWPPTATVVPFFLRSRGRANAAGGDGTLSRSEPGPEPPDIFIYDPAQPVPSAGGHSCCWPDVAPMGPADQAAVEALRGVLVYTSPPLAEDLVVAGAVTAELHAVTDAADTDWVVTLCDVDQHGRSVNLQEGIVRARFRRSLDHPVPVASGEPETYRVDLGSLFHVFRRGHRIRVQVTSSSFPAWEPNPNTGRPLGVDTVSDRVAATQHVLHAPGAASCVHLPVLEGMP